MIDEVRRIAYNLRPPALDEVGLVGALRQHIVAFDEGGPTGRVIRATLDAPDALPAAAGRRRGCRPPDRTGEPHQRRPPQRWIHRPGPS